MNLKKISWKQILSTVIIVGIVLFYYFLGCPIRVLLGISCPGCGMTRAAASIISGNFYMASCYNVFVYFIPIPIIAFLFRKKAGMRTFYFVSAVFIIALFIYYIVRLTHGSEIVYFMPEKGLIYKLILFLKRGFSDV